MGLRLVGTLVVAERPDFIASDFLGRHVANAGVMEGRANRTGIDQQFSHGID